MANDVTSIDDALPNISYPIRYSSPEHLHTLATILGMAPTRVDRCRVLEIGCSSGGNLLPLAHFWPDSKFVGIDPSQVQIDHGVRDVAALGLSNMDLRRIDILDVDESFGKFDYILCHGVYSHVPDGVKQKVLSICSENLAPEGVALVSYNTYPGWHDLQAMREMMMFHVAGTNDPHQQVQHARLITKWLAETVPENFRHGLVYRERHNELRRSRDTFVYHEFLKPTNSPEYFFEFMQKADAKGLAYVGDANTRFMLDPDFLASAEENLSGMRDPIRREQYLDFLRHRRFRYTLLRHRDRKLGSQLDPERLGAFYVASSPRIVADAEVNDGDRTTFRFPNEVVITTREPILREALIELASAWPNPVRLNELFERAAAQVMLEQRDEQRSILCGRVVHYFLHQLIEFSSQPLRATTIVGQRPAAFALARYQAGRSEYLSNLKHECMPAIELKEVSRRLLPLLDGQRTTEEIEETLRATDHQSGVDAPVSRDDFEAGLQQLADRFFLLNA